MGDLNLNWVIHRSLLFFTGPKWWCMMRILLAGHCFTACFSWQSIQWLINALINGAWKAKKDSVTSVARLKWSLCSGGYSSAREKKEWQWICIVPISVKAPLAVHENAAKAHSYLMLWEPSFNLAVFTKQGGGRTAETNNISKSVVHADTRRIQAAGQPPAKILIKFTVWWLCKLSDRPNVLEINISSLFFSVSCYIQSGFNMSHGSHGASYQCCVFYTRHFYWFPPALKDWWGFHADAHRL